ncbi:hypothetical protein [Deinococcus multiflagellatus]|uniref:Uncharacterized protein n=1 Tax=Deinococcus multiflagellatus TaxID=1656887 RepID=A0ABW1ZT11_9DEIO
MGAGREFSAAVGFVALAAAIAVGSYFTGVRMSGGGDGAAMQPPQPGPR